MKTVSSISGGKTSAYMAHHYPTDINLFSLMRLEDKDFLWMDGKDEKTRQLVSDKIGKEFIGTPEQDDIVYTILDLEQHLGKEIKWLTGDSFEGIIKSSNGYLPNQRARRCTIYGKLIPIFDHLNENELLPVEMNIGYRATEISRADKIRERCDDKGMESFKTVIGVHDSGSHKGKNKWGEVGYRFPRFPIIEDNIPKDVIYAYWEGKNVRFAYKNNCVGCFHRNPLFLAHMAQRDKKMEWFARQEEKTGNFFIDKNLPYRDIMNYGKQTSFFDDEFSDCDSGYCSN